MRDLLRVHDEHLGRGANFPEPWRRAHILLLAYWMVGAAVVTYVPTRGTGSG